MSERYVALLAVLALSALLGRRLATATRPALRVDLLASCAPALGVAAVAVVLVTDVHGAGRWVVLFAAAVLGSGGAVGAAVSRWGR